MADEARLVSTQTGSRSLSGAALMYREKVHGYLGEVEQARDDPRPSEAILRDQGPHPDAASVMVTGSDGGPAATPERPARLVSARDPLQGEVTPRVGGPMPSVRSGLGPMSGR